MNRKKSKCFQCDGTGHRLIMGEEPCPRCGGTGRDKRSNCWSKACGNCNGVGKVSFCRRDPRPCFQCQGCGYVDY